MMIKQFLVLLVLSSLILTACKGTPIPDLEVATQTAQPIATATSQPTETPEPTDTPEPTATPPPTHTATPTPTSTPVPTPETVTEDVYVVSDDTWKFARDPSADWQQMDDDDSSWLAVSSESCREIGDIQPACIWDDPYVPYDILYFRKVFDVAQIPPRARVVTLVDDDVDIYLNGVLVLHDGDDVGTAGISWWEIEVTDLLQPGTNILAFRGVDWGEGTAYIQTALGLCYRTEDRYAPIVEIMNHWEGWFDSDVYVEAVDAPCDSGVTEVAYRVDGGAWQVVDPHERFQLPFGEHDVEARATDRAGRQGFDSWHFLIGQPPTITTTAASSETAQEHADRAAEYVARSHWDEAITEISRAIELDPANPQYYVTRAFLYDAGKGMMEEAVADATKAIELAPTLYDAWNERGAIYSHMGECALAVADHGEAIRLDPERFNGYTYRADALRCQGELNAAIADYGRAIDIDPTSAWTYWNRGMLYEQKGDLGTAIADYDQAIALEPNDPWASPDWYYSRAGAHRALSQHGQALADCDAALALVFDDPRGFYCRGLSEVAIGQVNEARADFERAVSLTPISAWSAWVTNAAQAELDKMKP